MKYTTILILAILGVTLTQSDIPQNYCDNKHGARCSTCVFNQQFFYNQCTRCGRNGFATPVPGRPGVTECRKLERYNSWCEVADALGTCELCREGGYWELSSKTCYEYLEETKVENCVEYTGDVAGMCSTCKGGLIPSADRKTCITIPPLVPVNFRILADPAPLSAAQPPVDPANYVNCDLVGVWIDDASVVPCYTCKEGFYKINGKCTGVVAGDLTGCLEGDATLCFACNTVAGYVMRTPYGKCQMNSGILSSVVAMIALLVFKL